MEYLQTLLSTESDFHNVQWICAFAQRAADFRRQQIMSLLASRSILRYNRHRLELAENKSRFQGFGLEHTVRVFPRIRMKNRPHMLIFRQGNDDCDQFYACNKQGRWDRDLFSASFELRRLWQFISVSCSICKWQCWNCYFILILFICLFIYYYTTLVIYLFCNILFVLSLK